jgi:thioesterase domain-containing protein
MSLAESLQQTLHHEIPLTRAMGISVPYYDGQLLQLAAPLGPNINHKSTAFGGSLYTLAVSCGWGMVHLKLQEAGLHRHIVIQEAEIKYLLPVDTDMVAECALQDSDLNKFFNMLHKHGIARLTLEVTLHHRGKLAVRFSGRYVVHQ